MKKIILLFSLLLTACITDKKIEKICKSCPRQDSIVEKIVIKDSITEVPVYIYDTLISWLPNPCQELCDENGNLKPFKKVLTTNKGTKHVLETKDNKLVLSDEINGLKKTVPVTKRTVDRSRIQKTTVAADCHREHKDWFDKYDRPGFFILLGIVIVRWGWKKKAWILKIFKLL